MPKKEKTKPENQHPNKIGIKEAMGYALGDAGNLFVLTYVSYALKVFYTDLPSLVKVDDTSLALEKLAACFGAH